MNWYANYKNKKRTTKFAASHRSQHERLKVRHARAESRPSVERPGLKVPELIKRDAVAVIGTVILVIAAFYVLAIRNPRFQLTEISITGAQYLSADEITQAAQGYLDSKFVGIVTRDTYWSAHEGSVERAIRDRFSDSYALDNVNVDIKYPNLVSITVVERIPSLAWVTHSTDKREHYYTIDRDGVVTEELVSFADLDPSFPRVRDDNRPELGLGWQIISKDYIDAVFFLHANFTAKTGLPLDAFAFPATTCQDRQFVAEKLFQQQILESGSDEFRSKRIEIQEMFQSGELSIDQSLDELERVKEEELLKLGEENLDGFERLQWETVYVETLCDYVVVATDLHLEIPDSAGGFTVRFDTRQDLTVQMENLASVLKSKVPDRSAVQYIDVRIPDRVYIK
ncbi:MAG: hypothetical protein CO132_05365 [Candidatus Kerfeldbacteria bacterium CG_4_9_14_3_um_filter_45_8]|nr:MAG: hypothetical protein CO132_05365 [Candidatus Kerfeldbacteria bacterium CG_4_9_14_3_um_filter_45_8]